MVQNRDGAGVRSPLSRACGDGHRAGGHRRHHAVGHCGDCLIAGGPGKAPLHLGHAHRQKGGMQRQRLAHCRNHRLRQSDAGSLQCGRCCRLFRWDAEKGGYLNAHTLLFAAGGVNGAQRDSISGLPVQAHQLAAKAAGPCPVNGVVVVIIMHTLIHGAGHAGAAPICGLCRVFIELIHITGGIHRVQNAPVVTGQGDHLIAGIAHHRKQAGLQVHLRQGAGVPVI